MLPASIQVCPVELPGRGRRQGDAPINDVARLADVLVESLPLQARCPAAFCAPYIFGMYMLKTQQLED